MDDADIAAALAEREAPALIAASRKPAGPIATGRCLYCDEQVAEEARWCDSVCRDEWEKERRLRKQA